MKKGLTIVTLASAMLLAGCSSNNANTSSDGISVATSESAKVETPKADEIAFKGNVANISDARVEITDYKVIKPGEAGNENGDKSIIAFSYSVTNKTDKEITPFMIWNAIFRATQDNDPNKVTSLNIKTVQGDATKDDFATIKKDGTVKSTAVYALADDTTPVKLIATQGVMGPKIGEQEYTIK